MSVFVNVSAHLPAEDQTHAFQSTSCPQEFIFIVRVLNPPPCCEGVREIEVQWRVHLNSAPDWGELLGFIRSIPHPHPLSKYLPVRIE